ncbi:MAG: signal peptide peptidase SppA, type [Hyphomicrobiales bacterium]|nr:signal peptide peptidase SppA, type [Hyphomicrobiales bacterium]
MSFPNDADFLVDRRLLRRKLTFWRVALFSVLAAILIALGVHYTRGDGGVPGGRHIARLAIEGVITGDKDTLKLIKDIGAARNADALIVTIESPGGTTTGAERLYKELRLVAEKKPVVAVIGTMAASGGYIAALGTDRIFAEGNSLVGSIGVLFQFPNFSRLLDTVGVAFESVKSSPLKASPSGVEPTSPEARAALAALVTDSFNWFKDLVKDRRHLDDTQLASVSDGRVFTGRQGMNLKLVDALGGEHEAIAWLEQEKKVTKDLPVRDWKKERSLERLGILGVSAALLDTVGLETLAAPLRRLAALGDARLLDGLVSVWQVAPVD